MDEHTEEYWRDNTDPLIVEPFAEDGIIDVFDDEYRALADTMQAEDCDGFGMGLS